MANVISYFMLYAISYFMSCHVVSYVMSSHICHVSLLKFLFGFDDIRQIYSVTKSYPGGWGSVELVGGLS